MSKQEEIKQALAAAKPSTELYMVWDQRDGLMCIAEYDKAAQEYEEQLEAAKVEVSSYGSEGNERVVFARIEKQAHVTIYETSEHSDLMAAWDEYERENTENVELERLRKDLEEERLQSQRYAHMLIAERLIHDINKKELELTLNALHQISDAEWEENTDNQFNDVFTTRTINPIQIANEALALVGQEGEGNHEPS